MLNLFYIVFVFQLFFENGKTVKDKEAEAAQERGEEYHLEQKHIRNEGIGHEIERVERELSSLAE